MASSLCPPSPLLVRASHPCTRLQWKLEKYFQSRESGGGECTVLALDPSDPTSNTVRVQFNKRAGELRAGAGWQPPSLEGPPGRSMQTQFKLI